MFSKKDTNAMRYAIYRTHLTEKHVNTLYAYMIEKFPEGYGYKDILIIEKPGGDKIKVVEVITEDTIYLVKIRGMQ